MSLFGRVGPPSLLLECKETGMPLRRNNANTTHNSNFPIGLTPNYIDYLNANVNNQLNLFNITHSRHHSADDGNPGSPEGSHGGAARRQQQQQQPAHQLIPASFAPSPSYSTQSLASPEDGPFIPLPQRDQHYATGNASAMRSTFGQGHD